MSGGLLQVDALEAHVQEPSPGTSELAENVTAILLCIGQLLTPESHSEIPRVPAPMFLNA